MAPKPPYLKLVLVPAVITLAVTLLRLTGELLGWSPALFNRQAGGGGALVGIAWLVPVFGIYFALKLVHLGFAPSRLGPAFGWPALGLALVVATGLLTAPLQLGTPAAVTLFAVASVAAVLVALRGWRDLGDTLLVYAVAARIPVALVMLGAMIGNWGTHYDAPPPDFPRMGLMARFVVTGLIPQFTIWIAFTVVLGMLFGGLALAVARARSRPATA